MNLENFIKRAATGDGINNHDLLRLLAHITMLERFYNGVAKLTLNHDQVGGIAAVYPSKLGPLLEEVDKEWWKNLK